MLNIPKLNVGLDWIRSASILRKLEQFVILGPDIWLQSNSIDSSSEYIVTQRFGRLHSTWRTSREPDRGAAGRVGGRAWRHSGGRAGRGRGCGAHAPAASFKVTLNSTRLSSTPRVSQYTVPFTSARLNGRKYRYSLERGYFCCISATLWQHPVDSNAPRSSPFISVDATDKTNRYASSTRYREYYKLKYLHVFENFPSNVVFANMTDSAKMYFHQNSYWHNNVPGTVDVGVGYIAHIGTTQYNSIYQLYCTNIQYHFLIILHYLFFDFPQILLHLSNIPQ